MLCRLTSKVPTVLYFPYSTHFYHILFYIPDIVYNTRKQHAYLGFSARTLSISFFFPIASIQSTINQIKHRICLCCLGTRGGVSKPHNALGYASCFMSFSTPSLMLYFPYNTHTGDLSNT